jgi:pyrimidine operon attenuation protein/uracil phosphoribosyltransferase
MAKPKQILDKSQLNLTLKRLMFEIVENVEDFDNFAIIGLQPRGVLFSRMLKSMLENEGKIKNLVYGELDITFYRDDYRRNESSLVPSKLDIDFDIEGRNILLVDDVLYTGRTIRAALDAIADFGRPKKVELMALIDRRYNRELPIEADYVGQTVDTRGTGLRVQVDLEGDTPKVTMVEIKK